MLPFRPKLRGPALFTWVIGMAAMVVALLIWLLAYERHRMVILPLLGIGLVLSGLARELNRRSTSWSSRTVIGKRVRSSARHAAS